MKYTSFDDLVELHGEEFNEALEKNYLVQLRNQRQMIEGTEKRIAWYQEHLDDDFNYSDELVTSANEKIIKDKEFLKLLKKEEKAIIDEIEKSYKP
ncbi:MAG: hypothetical protein HRU28_01325 [Rhizobiales bacterium]|nr:hypothetical protein [Hyphomicrobiales bacterium]